MKLSDIISELEPLLPILGSALTGHSEISPLAARLIQLGEEEIARRQATGQTRSQILADAETTFVEAKIENDKLKKLGHEVS